MHQRERERGGYHVSPSKTFVPRYQKDSLGNSSVFQKISCIAKFYASEGGGVSRFSVENFCHTVPKNFIGGNLSVLFFTKLRWKILSHSADKIRRRTLVFRKNSGIENFQAKEGEASRFCRKFFYLTGPKKLRQGTILCFTKVLVGKKVLWIRGGRYHDFPSESFCLTVPKYSVGDHFGVPETFLIENFHV